MSLPTFLRWMRGRLLARLVLTGLLFACAQRAVAQLPDGFTPAIREQAPDDPARALIASWKEGDPVLAFDPPTVDLGTVAPGAKLTVAFRLINVSPRPVQITRFIFRSGTYRSWPDTPIPPGHEQSGLADLRAFSSEGIEHTAKWTVQVRDGPPMMYSIRYRTEAQFEFSPKILTRPTLRQMREYSPTSDVHVRSLMDLPFSITSLSPHVVVPSTEPAMEHVIRIEWSKWPSDTKPNQFTVIVDQPRTRHVTRVIRPPQDAIKDGLIRLAERDLDLDLGSVAADATMMHKVTITNTSQAPLHITSIIYDSPAVVPASHLDALDAIGVGDSIVLELPVTPRTGYTGPFKRQFRLMIDDEVPATIVLRGTVSARP